MALAYLAPSGRAAVTIDPMVSEHSAAAMVSTDVNKPASGFFRLPVVPGTPDGGLPVAFDHQITYPFIAPFPTISQGFSALRFSADLSKTSADSFLTLDLKANATATYTPGQGSQTPGYAAGRARVALRLTSAPGTRLHITARAHQVGGLCLFDLVGTDVTFQLRGTGAVQQSFVFHDGVARLEWIVHAEVRTDPSALINQPQANGSLSLVVEELGPPGPVFSMHPVATQVIAGYPLSLHASATAPLPVAYQWLRNGQPIPGATGRDLVLPCAQGRDAGDYAVVATSEGVVVTSQVATVTVDEPAPSPSRLVNLSTRGQSLAGDDVLIPGFVIAGTQPKRLLIRAAGPTLGGPPFGMAGVLNNPRLTLFRREASGNVLVAGNDDWPDNANAPEITTTSARVGAFSLGSTLEAALLIELEPGAYTAIVDGVSGATGVAIAELYDADGDSGSSSLVNISSRGHAGVGTHVMIPGFVVSSEGPKTLLVRAVGPTLAAAPFEIARAMLDPRLTVYQHRSGDEVPLFASDDWGDFSTAAEIESAADTAGAFSLVPGSKDAALVATFAPGVYTVVGSSADGLATGIVLVEIYVIR